MSIRFDTEPGTDWRNIFQLWRDNGERLPIIVAKNTWSAEAGHFLVIEKIEIKHWPYGSAWGQYFWKGEPGPCEKVKGAGTYSWKLLADGHKAKAD